MQVEQIDRDLLYLTKLADWCGGQGFCQIEGLTDPDEWCFEKWDELRPDSNGDDYSAEALAQSIHARHRHQARAEVVGEIVAWLRIQDDPSEKWALQNSHWYADEIEAKFGGRDGNE